MTRKTKAETIDWSLWIAKLGSLTNAEIAEQAGCTPTRVGQVRRQINKDSGLKAQGQIGVDWSKWADKFGVLSDAEIARQVGVSRERVRQIRESFGKPSRRVLRRSAVQECPLLGVLSDSVVAKELHVAAGTVADVRRIKGIEAVPRKYHRTLEHLSDDELCTRHYKEIAKEQGCLPTRIHK